MPAFSRPISFFVYAFCWNNEYNPHDLVVFEFSRFTKFTKIILTFLITDFNRHRYYKVISIYTGNLIYSEKT